MRSIPVRVDGATIVQEIHDVPHELLNGGSGLRGFIELLVWACENRSISGGSRAHRELLDMSSLRDNQWVPVCFPGETLRTDAGGTPLLLSLEGVGSAPGSSVTTWLRPAGADEHPVQVVGTVGGSFVEADAELTLRYRFATSASPVRDRLFGIIGRVSLAAGLVVLAVAAFSSRVGSKDAIRVRRYFGTSSRSTLSS